MICSDCKKKDCPNRSDEEEGCADYTNTICGDCPAMENCEEKAAHRSSCPRPDYRDNPGTPDYFGMYQKKAKEHGFSEIHISGIIRYLLVNGHIEATPETLALMGDEEFHLSAKYLPKDMLEAAEKHYTLFPDKGEYVEENEVEHLETKEHTITGAHILNGKMVTFSVDVIRRVEVDTTYYYYSEYTPEGKWWDVFNEDLPPAERVKQAWDKSNICPHCDYEAESGTEGSSAMYDDGSCIVNIDCCGKSYYVIRPWDNKVCGECKYYEDCPFEGVPQPHCDEQRMKKDGS